MGKKRGWVKSVDTKEAWMGEKRGYERSVDGKEERIPGQWTLIADFLLFYSLFHL